MYAKEEMAQINGKKAEEERVDVILANEKGRRKIWPR